MADTFTEEELEMMSEEERQALQDEEESTEESDQETETAEEQIAAEESSEEEAEEEESGEEGGQGIERETGDEAHEQVSVEDQAAASDQSEDTHETTQTQSEKHQASQEQSADQSQTQDQEQAREDPDVDKRQELNDRLKDVQQKFDEGEMAFEDYLEQRDQIKDQIKDLDLTAKIRAEMEAKSQEDAAKAAEQQWNQDVATFNTDNQEALKDKALYNTFVKQANAKLADSDFDNMGNRELLDQALKEAKAINGYKETPTNDEVAEARRKANAKKKEQADQTQTLGDVPSAADNDTGKDEFAYLEKLSGEALEEALAKLSPEQEKRYLMGTG